MSFGASFEFRATGDTSDAPVQPVARPMLVASNQGSTAIVTRWRSLILKLLASWRHRLTGRPPLSCVPGILAIVSDGECRETLKAIFEHSAWALITVDASQISFELESDMPFGVILYQRAGANWGSQVARLAGTSPRPWIILLSDTADKNLWDELGRNGGSDIVRLPLSREAVVEAVQRGLALWRNQQKLRLQPKPGIPVDL